MAECEFSVESSVASSVQSTYDRPPPINPEVCCQLFPHNFPGLSPVSNACSLQLEDKHDHDAMRGKMCIVCVRARSGRGRRRVREHEGGEGLRVGPSVCLSLCLSVSLSLCLSVSLPLYNAISLYIFCLPACLPSCLPSCLPACLSVSIYLSVCLSVCLPACLLVYPSARYTP